MMPFTEETRRCRVAQQHWRTLPVRERLRFVKALRPLIVSRRDTLCDAVASDVNRVPWEVAGTDLLPSAAMAKFLVRNARSILASRKASRPLWLLDCREEIHRRPHGLVGVIGTWNYPVYLTLGAIVPALVAGNGVLWKPSENTPRTAEVLDRLLRDSGVPQDLLIRLPSDRDVGAKLCEAEIDHIHFTGSDIVGRKIAARLGERLITSTLELSGCDAFIVQADADLNLAVRTAWYGTMLNHGQTCISARRAFVATPLFEDFVNRMSPLVEQAPSLPLVTNGQVEQLDRFVSAATRDGIRVVRSQSTGGAAMTMLVDPPANFPACVEASFAPIISVLPFASNEELLQKVHASPFGLSSSIITNDTAAGRELAATIVAGSVIVNDTIVPTANPSTPFGGRGASGWGSTKGAEGLLGMTVPQVVSTRRGRFRPHVNALLDRDPGAPDTMLGLLRVSHGNWRDAWSGLWQLLRGLRRSV